MTSATRLAAASLAALALLFTGCAAQSASSSESKADASAAAEAPAESSEGQTTEDACAVMEAGLQELTGLDSVDTSDPAAAIEALRTAAGTLTEAAAGVENADVKSAAEGAASSLEDYVTYVEGILADPANADLSAMTDEAVKLQTGISGLTDLCAAA